MLGGGAGRSRLLDLFGSTVAKEKSTVDEKRNTVDSGNRSDDDDIIVIEPMKERPRLRGGSTRTKEKDADEEEFVVDVLGDDGYYMPDYDDNNLQMDQMDDGFEIDNYDQQMPSLTPEEPHIEEIPQSPNRRRRCDIISCETALTELNEQVNSLFEEGDEVQALAMMEQADQINKKLAELKNEEAAWEIHKEEEKARREDDERVLRKIRGGAVEEEEGHGQGEYWEPNHVRESVESENARRRRKIEEKVKVADDLYYAAQNFSDDDDEEQATGLRNQYDKVIAELEELRAEEQVWLDHQEAEKRAKEEETDQSDASVTGQDNSYEEEKEKRGKEEGEEEGDLDSSIRKTRKITGRRMIEDTEDEYEESGEEEKEKMEEENEEEKEDEEEEEGEMEMEEVSIVRRKVQRREMDIGEWILHPIPPSAAPTYVSVGEMERRQPRVRRQWREMAEQCRIRQQRPSGDIVEPAAAAAAAPAATRPLSQREEDDSDSDFLNSILEGEEKTSSSDKKKTAPWSNQTRRLRRRRVTRSGRFECAVGEMKEGKEHLESPHSSDNDESYEPSSKRRR